MKHLHVLRHIAYRCAALSIVFMSFGSVAAADTGGELYSYNGQPIPVFTTPQSYCDYLTALSGGSGDTLHVRGVVFRRSGTPVSVINKARQLPACAGVIPILAEVETRDPRRQHGYVLRSFVR